MIARVDPHRIRIQIDGDSPLFVIKIVILTIIKKTFGASFLKKLIINHDSIIDWNISIICKLFELFAFFKRQKSFFFKFKKFNLN